MNLLKMINLMENFDPRMIISFLEKYLENPYDLDNLYIAADYLEENDNPIGEMLRLALNTKGNYHWSQISTQWPSVAEKASNYLESKNITALSLEINFQGQEFFMSNGVFHRHQNGLEYQINPEIWRQNPEVAEGFFFLIAYDLIRNPLFREKQKDYMDNKIVWELEDYYYNINHALDFHDHAGDIYHVHSLFSYLQRNQTRLKITGKGPKSLMQELLVLLERHLEWRGDSQFCMVYYSGFRTDICSLIRECISILQSIL